MISSNSLFDDFEPVDNVNLSIYDSMHRNYMNYQIAEQGEFQYEENRMPFRKNSKWKNHNSKRVN